MIKIVVLAEIVKREQQVTEHANTELGSRWTI